MGVGLEKSKTFIENGTSKMRTNSGSGVSSDLTRLREKLN